MKYSVLFLIAVVLLGAAYGWEDEDSENGMPPGMKFAITQKGLTYALSTMQAKILAGAKKAKLPPKSGHQGPCDYNFHGGHVEAVSAAPFQIRPVAGSGVEVDVTKLMIQVRISHHFHCCKRFIFKFCQSFDGWSLIRFQDASIKLHVAVGAAGGKPTLTLSSVKFNRGKLTVQTHSSHAGDIAKGIWNDASRAGPQIEKKIKGQFDSYVKQILAKLPLIKKHDQYVEMDLSMIDRPHIAAGAVTTIHKGEFYAIAHHHEAPFPASPMPDGDSDGMAQVLLSDYLVNSAGFAYYDAGLLHRTITDKDLPAQFPVRLNTKTFEDIFPTLYAKYPDKMMSIEVSAPKTPSAQIVEGKLVETVVVDLGFNVLEAAGATKAFVFTLDLVADATVRVEGNAVKGQASLAKMDVKLKESSIGPIDVEPCRPLFEMVVKEMVIPKVNAKLEKGFSLPVVQGFHFVSPRIAVKPGYIVLRTDLALKVAELDPFPFEVEQALEEEQENESLFVDQDEEAYVEAPEAAEDIIVDAEEPVIFE